MIKKVCIGRSNTKSWEQGVLEDITCIHLWSLENVRFTGVDLLGARPASQKLLESIQEVFPLCTDMDTTTAKTAQVNTRAVETGDVVAYFQSQDWISFGEVCFHFKHGVGLWTCISEWELVMLGDNSAKCKVCKAPRIYPTSCILEPCVHWPAKLEDISTILYPPKLKQRCGGC